MRRFAILGKANSGKNTVGKLIKKQFKLEPCKYIAFADPIKKIAKLMFPSIPERFLTGSSKFRSEIIPNAFKNGKPLTIRQLLIDIGNGAREYDPDIWIKALNQTLEKNKDSSIIITDERFRNEFDFLKKMGFTQIRIYREDCSNINDISETGQDEISDSEFDYIIYNNKSIKKLKEDISKIAIM